MGASGRKWARVAVVTAGSIEWRRLGSSDFEWCRLASIGFDEPEWLGVPMRGLNSLDWFGVALKGLEWWGVVSAPELHRYSVSGVEWHRVVLRAARGVEWRRLAVGRDALGPDAIVMTRVTTT